MPTLLSTSARLAVCFFTLIFSGYAQAALIDFNITGSILVPGNVTAPTTVEATGIFDDSVLTSGEGTINFFSGSSNTIKIVFDGAVAMTQDNDNRFSPTDGAKLVFNNSASSIGDTLNLASVDWLSTVGVNDGTYTSVDFGSLLLDFDENNDISGSLFGSWTAATFSPVPVPAAVWLFITGLLGLAGVARRKKV
jgi:hypothetical protein